MTGERRLAALYEALSGVGLRCLVMGGHAVRFYGVDRNTVDYDFHIAADASDWDQISQRFAASDLLRGAAQGPSWRAGEFKRFIIGRLPDGGISRSWRPSGDSINRTRWRRTGKTRNARSLEAGS